MPGQRASRRSHEAGREALDYCDRRQAASRHLPGPDEIPVTLSLNDTAMVTLLASSEELEALAIGHAFTAGWIERSDQVEAVSLARLRHGLAVRLAVSARLERMAADRRRFAPSVSSCGACGVVEESQVMAGLTRLAPRPPLSAAALVQGLAALEEHARPGLHCALGLDEAGRVMTVGRDIGRHNALDRVIGHGLRSGRQPQAVLLSSRCSLELVQKSVRAGIATLATLALPSGLAVDVARVCGLNLVCCHRGRELELLSGHPPYDEHGKP